MVFQNVGIDILGLGSSLITRAWDLQRTYNFQVILPGDVGGFFGIEVSQYCVSARAGNYDFSDVGKMKYGPQQRFYAGLQSIDRANFTFVNPTDNSVLNYFLEWSYLAIDRDGYYYPKNNYAKDVYIVTYDQNKVETNKFRLRGCFPVIKPKIAMDYGSETVMILPIILSVDSVEVGSVFAEITNIVRRVTKVSKYFK